MTHVIRPEPLRFFLRKKIWGGVSFGGRGFSTIDPRYPLEFCFNEFSLFYFEIIKLINILSHLQSIN